MTALSAKTIALAVATTLTFVGCGKKEEAAKPAVVQANDPDAQTTILEWWARRPAGQRRSSYLAQALNIKMDRLLDICREIGELAVTSHMSVLSVEQAGKIAQAVRQQGG